MKRLLIISLILVVLDQITKFIFTGKEYLIGSFGINYVENTGAAFGMFKNLNWFFIAFSILVIIFIFYYYKQIKWKTPLILILAGTIGNLIDRIFFNYVRDFVMVWIWPVFNIADICVTVGVLLLVFYLYREDKTYKSKNIRK
jgi:signal peptidase II